jgi:vanillate monooxygenase ferredoxin subunit
MTNDALRSVIVAKKIDQAHNMVSFELVDPFGDPLPAFSAGSHIDVTLPGGLVRQYSLCNSASERNRYVIGVWNDPNSRGGSKALHRQVNQGDTLQIGLPRNRFRVPRGTKRAILIARGVGITPLLSIADYLEKKNIPFELHYVYALMSPDAFRGMILESTFSEKTIFYYEASELNRLLKAPELLGAQPEDTQLFICGADWWLDPIVKTAQQKGWTEERIHIERFTGKVPAAVLDRVFTVKVASTGAEYQIPGDKTVTGYLEELGVKIPTSCEQGMCGACQTKVLEGEVDHRDKRLSAQQREQGLFLACVSRAKGDRLVLDL